MNSSHHAIVALLFAIVALTGCPRPRKQCLAGQDYFADFDDCLWRCNDPATPPGERCVESDGGVRESGVGRSDASDVVNDMTAAPADSAVDVTMGDIATDGDASEGVAAPRQVFPLSLVMLSGNQPTLKWALANGTDGASIELCRDRALTAECQRWSAVGSESRVPMALARGPWFWRLRGRAGMRDGSATSAIWYFWSSGRASARDATYAQIPDVNGDGLADVVWVENDEAGLGVTDGGARLTPRVRVQLGQRGTTPSAPSMTELTGMEFVGSRLIADVNGDGFGDLVGTRIDSAPVPSSSVVVLFGSATGLRPTPRITSSPDATFALFGTPVLAIGDADGDGWAEFASCSPVIERDSTTPGRCHLYSSNHEGIEPRPRRTLSLPTFGPGVSVRGLLGQATSQGDVNGDGFGDLMLVSDQYLSDRDTALEERVWLFLGQRAGIADRPSQSVLSPERRNAFGFNLSILGDQDGDGALETVLAAPLGSGAPIFVFNGDASGVRTPARQVLPSTISGERNRASIAIGDVDGDGLGDVAIGRQIAPIGPPTQEIELLVHFGTTTGIQGTGSRFATRSLPSNEVVLVIDLLAGIGDVDGDGLFDVFDERRQRLCFGERSAVPGRCQPVVAPTVGMTRMVASAMF